jgi:DNA-binding NtrC family response regulator
VSLILVVDDVEALAEQYAYDLRRLGGFRTRVATTGRQALDELVEATIDCMILDLEMPDMDGFEVLRAMAEREIVVPVIVYTGTGDFDRCAQAIRLGAYGFIDKAESMNRVVHEVRKALEQGELRSEIRSLRRELGGETALVGSSPPMQRLRSVIERLAPIPSPVLIQGESGSGKELVARELHRMSPAASAPFVPINCAALAETLLESELFGHERGAFTGADRTRKGAFERAGRGILFLDEVGELSPQAQAKLLRVVEERRISRLGGEEELEVEARVAAATNRDLETEAAEGRFREDLLYRLNVHVITVPPLRERLSDVPELVDHLLAVICQRFGMRRKGVTPEALDALTANEWRRNNVRELRNIVERLVIAADGDTIEARHIPPEVRGDAGARKREESGTFRDRKAEAEKRIVLDALSRNRWHVTRAAEELGLADHASLLKIMRRHGIRRGERGGTITLSGLGRGCPFGHIPEGEAVSVRTQTAPRRGPDPSPIVHLSSCGRY